MKIIQIASIDNPDSNAHVLALSDTGRIFVGVAIQRLDARLIEYSWSEVTPPDESPPIDADADAL